MNDQGEILASIVVPAYNAERFIAQALASVLSQTEQRCEVLVIDDASTDATAAIVAQIAKSDGRVRLLRNAVNRGPAASRNRGIAEARGDWIGLLDADDEFMPTRIEALISLGEQHGADIVVDNVLLCPRDAPGQCEPMLSPKVLGTARWLSAAEFVAGNNGGRRTPRVSYGFLQPIIRRRFLDAHGIRYNERNRFGEDFMLYVVCLLQGARWWITPEAMYRYRISLGSLTDVQSAGDLLRIRLLEDDLLRNHPMVASDLHLAKALRSHKRKIEHFYYYRAFVDAVRAGAISRAIQLLFESANGFCHIALESIAQAPRVAAKALRGGYRSHATSTRIGVADPRPVSVSPTADSGSLP